MNWGSGARKYPLVAGLAYPFDGDPGMTVTGWCVIICFRLLGWAGYVMDGRCEVLDGVVGGDG